jgi:hypothetical protein
MGAIDYLREHGFEAKVVDSRLVVSPATKLTADVRSYIKEHKLELIEVLSAANEPMTPQQVGWITAVSSLLEVSASYLIDDGFIDHYDLEEQMHADPRNVARLIKSDPRWRH